MNLPIHRAVELIQVAEEEHEREIIYRLYLVDRPYLKEQKAFNQYYDDIVSSQSERNKVKMDNRDKDEIMRELLG